MTKGNEKKHQLLGMNAGTAFHQLRKSIIFQLVCETGKDSCFRCEEKIETVAEFSIEHKDAWMSCNDPLAAFFDLNNIAFSHYSCNCKAASKPRKYDTEEQRKEARRVSRRASDRKSYTAEKRTEKYKRIGK